MATTLSFGTVTMISAVKGWRVPANKQAALEVRVVRALESEHGARFVRSRDIERQAFYHLADFHDLRGAGFSELARFNPQRILKPHSHVRSLRQAQRRKRNLVAA